MYSPSRRGFMMGCSAAIANLATARFTNMVFADPLLVQNHDTLIVLFLRGGMDSLSFVMPTAGADRGFYETARPQLKIPASGTNAALPLGAWGANQFGLHPAATHLHGLYQSGHVAFVHAAGLDTSSRSHFDNQAQIELGTPGDGSTNDGWLTRHFLTSPGLPADTPLVQRIAVSSTIQSSWLADTNVVAFANRDDFLFNTGPSSWRDAQKTSLRNILELQQATNPRYASGLVSLDASGFIEQNVPTLSSYVPANGAVYPTGSFGDSLKVSAQLIKLDMGLRAATLDLGGWDTHNGQGTANDGQYFWEKIQELSQALAAFYLDLDGTGGNAYAKRTTVAVMSEFGRRFEENTDQGTDHGHGGVITLVGGPVVGGMHGTWPGLANGQLFDHADLAITTDFRRVLSEILVSRMDNPNWQQVFPGYAGYTPLGVVRPVLFEDGFESGSTGTWSSTAP
ncbi:MAG: DUF1501 domain-containing protein [Thermoanaerobaculia bacterium]